MKPLVLMTGSSGLIGSRITQALVDSYHVVGLDVKPPRDAVPESDFLKCDLTSDESVRGVLSQVEAKHGRTVASVVHLAAYYDFSGEPSDMYEKLTVEGTRRLLRHLKRQTGVEQFIFSSSLLVMQPADPGETITESSPTEATWEYPESKIKAEEVIRQEHGGIPAVVLRIAGVYDEDCHSIPIAQQISRIYEKKLESYFFPGDASRGQPFIHLDDLVSCIVQTIDKRKEIDPYEVLLIAEPDIVSYGEMQDRVGEALHGREWPTVRIPKILAKAGAWVQDKLASEDDPTFIKPWMVDLADAHYPVDISRARRVLGWQPQHRLRDTIDEMVQRLKQNPEKWYETNGLGPPD
jgi:nucleoside-diphosphate-sugar epimerase